jgi:RHS repeat-associated protein
MGLFGAGHGGRRGGGFRGWGRRGGGRRCRGFRARNGLAVLALSVPLALPGAGISGQQLRVPSESSIRSTIVHLVDWVTGHSSPAPAVPRQQAGTAAGKAHSAPAAVTRAVARATGYQPGEGRGQRPAYRAYGPAGKRFTTGPTAHGFDPRTSKLLTSAMTAKSDLFKNADGSYTRRIFQDPVNYQTSSGSWAPIDETLVKGSGGRWREKANSVGASFAAAGNDQVLGTLATADGAESASFSLAGAVGVKGVTSGSSVTYPGILPGTDVTETATATGISESLTLHSANVATSWIFPLTLTGLTASLNGGSVDLTDSSGKVVWVIPPAVARSGPVDLAKPDSQASSVLAYRLVSYHGGLALEMTLDSSWLDAPGRVFPVTIDPTFSPNAAGSTYTESKNGTAESADNGSSEFLPSGTVTDSNGTFDDIDFLDFSGVIGDQIPDQHVTAASLYLFDVWAYQCSYSEDVYAYQVTGAWSPSSTLKYPGPSYGTKDAQWTGVASSRACANTSGLPGMGAWIGLPFNSDGLALLNNWTLGGGIPNDGFAVVPSLTDEQMWKQFDSANDGNVTSSQGGNCTGNCEPYLQMTYTADTPPQIDQQYPPDNYNSPTLTPELIASGHDPDSWPNSSVQYDFTVYTPSGTKVATSGLISSGDWTVPSGDLSWGQTYYWTVQDYDGLDYSPTVTTNYFSTPVPQPLVTSGLSQNESGPGFDAGSGDYTTSATDAQVPTVGPALEITRDYNSQDPRVSGAFGAGWSSVLDMKVSPGQNSSAGSTATEVVTYPDGEEVAFGVTSSGTYVAPPGRYATLASVSPGGFTLTDKNDTVYTFTQSLGSGAYGITSIADALGHTETFSYNSGGEVTKITSASGRTLTISWATPAGAADPHVSSVVTDDATAGDSSTAETWGYTYSGDQLTTACPPVSTTACTAYAYTAGSDYPEAVLDSGPQSYWRLDETSGTAAASSVLLNEGTDDATYSGVSPASAGDGLAGSGAQAPDFNGTSSSVQLPESLGVNQAAYMAVSLWFETSTTGGMLFSYQRDPLNNSTTTDGYTPALYVGSDGKLNAQFWDNALAPMTSSAAVDDGKWHQVVLTAAGNTQALYLDGQKIASKSGTITVTGQQYGYLGAGFLGGEWPDEAHYQQNGAEGYATYYSGYLSDAAIWNRALTPAEVSAMYAAGTHAASLLTKVTRPSGSVYAQVSYDPLTSRAASVTDDNGGSWTVNSPTVSGSSQVYVASVLGAGPQDYYRLADSGTTDAVDQVLGRTAAYNNVTQGVTGGPFSDTTVDSFNGTSSYLALPSGDRNTTGPGTIGLWFKTTGSSEVLYSTQNAAVTAGASGPAFTPSLYVGSDGKLNGEFWVNDLSKVITSSAKVNDGNWHYAVLSAGTGTQSLYVDGALQGTSAATLASTGQSYVAVGAGYLGGSWPDIASTTTAVRWFTGDIAEVAWYPSQLTAAQVTDQWNASKYSSGLTPVQTDTVTDPGGHTLTWVYDMLNGGRVLSQTDARGETTTYGYDVDGFQDEVVNPDGDTTQTGYDVRGNVVSATTCQNQAADKCGTAYYTYYPDDTSSSLTPDPRNDVLLTSRDPRSASSADTTYESTYTYNSLGELTAETTPPVAGFSSGRTTSYLYTDGTTSAGGFNGAIPPKGLQYQETTPGGAVTTTLYYSNGDVAQVTDPDGLRTVYGYDQLGRETAETVYSNSYPNGLTTTYAYDANGQVTSETDPPATNRVTGAIHTAQTTTAYDADGDVTSQTVADTTGGDASRTVTRGYDSHDLLASETDAAGATTKYTYDAYGNVASETDADGSVTDYTYDGDGNLLTTTLENYTGSPAGSQSAAPLAEESRSYDPAGRLASVTDSMGRVTAYGYTDNGLLATVTDENSGGTQTFTEESDTYDAAGNLVQKITNNGDTTTNYTVDAASRVTSEVLDPSGLDRTTSISYTPDDQQASVTQSGSGGATQSTSYTYDPNGNMTSESVTQPGAGGPVAWYPLTQTSGTSVTDSASGGQPGTASGVTWTGSSASFSGTWGQDIATNGPALDTTGSFTVAAWVNLAGDTSDSQVVVSQSAGTDAGFYLKYFPSTGGWEFMRPQTDTTDPVNSNADSGTAAVTGTWTFVTGTYDANTGTMTLYVNGAAAGSGTDSTPIASHGPLLIGAGQYDGTTGNFFDGQIANVQVYPRALSASEVSSLYGLGQGGGDVTTGKLTTSWTLDQRGLPTSMTDPDGNVTGYSYDEAGRLAVTTQPPVTTEAYGGTPVTARPVTMAGYDTFGDTAESEDADGNVTTYGYDADGREVSETLPPYTPPGSSSAITATDTKSYDGLGQLTSATDALNNTTKYAYDQLGDLTSETAPDGSAASYAYDADGEQLSATGPTGAQTQSTYDFMGRQLTSTQVERYTGSGSAAYTTNFTYGTGGWLRKSVTPDGAATLRDYNPAGELTSVTDAADNVTGYKYDSLGRQTALVYPDGTSKVTGYDASGDVTSVANLDASGNTLTSTSSTYDGSGDQVSATDARDDTTTFTYDPTGSVTQEVQPVSSSSSITTSFGYDAAGNKTRYTDGNGNNWYYTYNPWGLQESRVEPATSQYSSAADSTFTTAYDADGHPVTETEPGGVTVTDTYNNVGELTAQAGSGADAATAARTFGYDPAGDLTSASTSDTASSSAPSNATSESFTYNDRGQVLTASGSAGSTSYAYNGDGLVTSVADAAGTTSYTYDSADRLSTLADPATGTTATYSYNNDSLVSQVSYGSDARYLSYDSLHRLTSDTLKTSGGSTVASISYGYNANGQITSANTTGLAGASSNSYTYDEAGRLTSWNNGTTTTSYGYDNNGNLTQDGSKTYTYDARDELTSDGTNSYTYTARGTQSSEVTASGTVAASFDAYGDQVTEGTQAYSYDALGRMTSDVNASTSAGYAFSYVGSTETLASDGTNTYTWDPSGTTLTGIGVSGGGTSGGVLAVTNAHGDVVGQFTSSGSSMSGSTGYDPWGNVTGTTGTVAGRLGFQSGWTDPATQKVAMGARWYDPAAGDFTSADTVQVSPDPDPAMADPFGYVGDDPIDSTDPTGHCGGLFSVVCSVGHAVAHGFDTVRHAAASAVSFNMSAFMAAMRAVAESIARATRNVVHHVVDAARRGIRAVHTVVERTYHYVDYAYHAVTHYAVHAYHRVTHVVRTAWHAARRVVHRARDAVVRVARSVVHHVASAARTVTHEAAKAAVWVGRHVQKAAVAATHFVAQHAAAIGGAVTGIAVFAGCMTVTAGAGTLACAAASGAAANAVSYAISAAQSHSFSWSGLGKSALAGAAEGAAGGALGEALSAAGGAVMSSLARDGAEEAGGLAGQAGDGAGDAAGGGSSGGSCTVGGQSFTAGTLVLLASGKAEAISKLRSGQKVLATDTRTGKNHAEAIAAVLVHYDRDLYDLKMRSGTRTSVIATTSNHLFWVPGNRGHGRWVKAAALRYGTHLRTPGGSNATVAGGYAPRYARGWMWDLTIAPSHDFYINTAADDVLVHNCGGSLDDQTYSEIEQAHGTNVAEGVDYMAQRMHDGSSTAADHEIPGIGHNLRELGDYLGGWQDRLTHVDTQTGARVAYDNATGSLIVQNAYMIHAYQYSFETFMEGGRYVRP